MNILLIAYYYPPINSGGTARPLQVAKFLSRMGHNVTVLTHTYGKTDWGEPGAAGTTGSIDTIDTIGAIRTIRIKDISNNNQRDGLFKHVKWLTFRLITESLNLCGIYHSIFSWWRRKVIAHADRIIEAVKPDVLVATYPPVETLEIAVYLAERYGIPLAADFRDGLLFEPIESSRMRRHRCVRLAYAAVEKKTCAVAVAVTTVSQPITQYFEDTYRLPHTLDVSNGYDPDDFLDIPEADLPKDCFNIVFTGRFGLSDKTSRIDYFFEGVRQSIRRRDQLRHRLRIHLVGKYNVEELATIDDLVEAGVVVPHGFMDKPLALGFQKAAQLLLIITSLERSSVATTKIFEYLYSGKPILALTHNTVLEHIVRETRSGWVVHPHKPDEISTLLDCILLEEGFKDSIRPDKEKIDGYSAAVQMEKLHRLLETIMREKQ